MCVCATVCVSVRVCRSMYVEVKHNLQEYLLSCCHLGSEDERWIGKPSYLGVKGKWLERFHSRPGGRDGLGKLKQV